MIWLTMEIYWSNETDSAKPKDADVARGCMEGLVDDMALSVEVFVFKSVFYF